jgi:ABC transporter family protein
VGELLADLAQPWPLALVINDIGRPAGYLPVFRHPRGERPLPAAGRVNRRGDPGGGCRAGDGVHSRTARRAGHPHRGIGLSGGQRQRVGIARALLLDTLVVLLEEPTTGLNKVAEEVVAQALTCIVHLTTASSTTRRRQLISARRAGPAGQPAVCGTSSSPGGDDARVRRRSSRSRAGADAPRPPRPVRFLRYREPCAFSSALTSRDVAARAASGTIRRTRSYCAWPPSRKSRPGRLVEGRGGRGDLGLCSAGQEAGRGRSPEPPGRRRVSGSTAGRGTSMRGPSGHAALPERRTAQLPPRDAGRECHTRVPQVPQPETETATTDAGRARGTRAHTARGRSRAAAADHGTGIRTLIRLPGKRFRNSAQAGPAESATPAGKRSARGNNHETSRSIHPAIGAAPT